MPRPAGEPSAVRRARKARNWTLEMLVEEIDLRTPGGHSGVTPSMVSGWELGRHTTSIGHRETLCEIYDQPPDVLFAHHLGLDEDPERSPERFFCANEQMAVVPIPSLTSHEAFDSGVVLGAAPGARLLDHGRQAYAAARRIETMEQVNGLEVVRDRSARA